MITFNAKCSIYNSRNKYTEHVIIEDGLKADISPGGKTHPNSPVSLALTGLQPKIL